MEPFLPRVVALSGFAQSGKDTSYEFGLKPHGYKRVAMADKLKAEVAYAFGVDVETINENKTLWRPMLVSWGELRRAHDPQYWIKRVFAQMNDTCRYCITDARYYNECCEVLSKGGRVYIIKNPNGVAANETEAASVAKVELELAPVAIINDSTKEMLGSRLWEAVSSKLRWEMGTK